MAAARTAHSVVAVMLSLHGTEFDAVNMKDVSLIACDGPPTASASMRSKCGDSTLATADTYKTPGTRRSTIPSEKCHNRLPLRCTDCWRTAPMDWLD